MDDRDLQNLLVGLIAVALLVAAYWLMSEMTRAGRLEECLAQRRRNCEQFAR